MARLQLRTPSGEVQNFNLERPFRLGREAICEVYFPEDGGLSRQHMAIEGSGDQWTVRDLASKNGTFLNGEKVVGTLSLKTGDVVQASKVHIIYEPEVSKPREPVMFENTGPATSVPQGTVVVSLKDLLEPEPASEPSSERESRQWDTPILALLRAGRELVGGRPLNELFRVILDLSLEAVNAERGALFTLENEQLVLQASSGGQFKISSAVREKVLQDRASLLIQNVFEDELLQKRESIILQGIRSLMAVPLQTEDRVIGFVYVDGNTFRRQFATSDLNLLTVMANVAAIRIERARLALVEAAETRMRMEIDQAAEIQRRHLPSADPTPPGLEITGENHSCRTVGGDYYDYLRLSDGRLVLLMADVAGKGLPAALMMMNVQANANALAENCATLPEFFTRLNKALIKHFPRNRFVTLFAAAVSPCGSELTYCNAGHNPGLLISASGEVRKLGVGGPFLGLIPFVSFDEETVKLNPGDQLVLYTDGITEAESPESEEFETERIAALATQMANLPAREMIDRIFDAVRDWTQGAPASDDRTLMVARRV